MTALNRQEENNYPKAVLISAGLMGAFLILSFFWYVSRAAPPEEIGTGGIIVNYGTADEGMGTDYMSVEEPSQDPDANNKNPDKVVLKSEPIRDAVAENSDKSIATQDLEDAPVIEKTKQKSIAPPIYKPEKTDTKPAINTNALYKGAKNSATGQGDGTGTKPGNQGDKDGDPLSPNYGSGGSGNGSVSLTLASRQFVSYPSISDDGQSSGKVAVEIHVGKDGRVVFARAGVRGTTITDQNLWRKCEQAVKGARLNQLESAPDEQVGRIIFNFRVD